MAIYLWLRYVLIICFIHINRNNLYINCQCRIIWIFKHKNCKQRVFEPGGFNEKSFKILGQLNNGLIMYLVIEITKKQY